MMPGRYWCALARSDSARGPTHFVNLLKPSKPYKYETFRSTARRGTG